jgi:hypothetical protein
MYGEDEVPMSVQLQHQGLSTPLQMIATPMPQMPGGNWNFQSQSHSQAQTPMPSSLTPAPMDNGMLNVDQSGSIIPPAGGSGSGNGSPEEEDEDDDEELKERERSSSAEESAEE